MVKARRFDIQQISELVFCHLSIPPVLFLTLISGHAVSAGYKALKGVNKVTAVFDVSMGSTQKESLVFSVVPYV